MSITYRHATLDNGLTVIGEVDANLHTAALGFFVKTGARDESSELMGVSHFLEHMMFKGSDTRDAAAVDRDFDDLGAVHNAYTSNEMTVFYTHTLPEHLPAAEEILSDIMRPALREQDFTEEKSVILEEIAMYDDHPFWVLYERAMEAYYREHPLSHRVLGTRETITALERNQMQSYFDHRYSADNTVVACAGAIDFDAFVARINDHCGQWPRTDVARAYEAPPTPADDMVDVKSSQVNRHYQLMITPAPALQDDRRFAAGMLAQILGDAEGSRLYWALVETGLAEEAQAQFDGRDGVGDYLLYFSCDPDQAGAVERVVHEELAKLVDSLDEDDLERQRSKVATAATLASERPAGRMQRLGRQWTYFGEYRPLEWELEQINAVTLADLRAVYDAFPFSPMVTATLRPEDAS